MVDENGRWEAATYESWVWTEDRVCAMVDVRKAIPRDSEYLSWEDLDGRGDVVLQIKSVQMEKRPSHWGRAKSNEILTITFAGAQKRMWVGKTNSRIIAGLHGWESDEWAGKSITLYIGTADTRDGKVPCVRVRGSARSGPRSLEDV